MSYISKGRELTQLEHDVLDSISAFGSANQVLKTNATEDGVEWGDGASVLTLEPTSGTIDDSNTDFVFASRPKVVVVNGVSYDENNGWTWTILTSTVTLSIPVGTGGTLFALA